MMASKIELLHSPSGNSYHWIHWSTYWRSKWSSLQYLWSSKKLLNEVSSKRVGFSSNTHKSLKGFCSGATNGVENQVLKPLTQENDLIPRYLSMASSLSFMDLLEPSRVLFYYYFIYGALFPLINIFIFNVEKSKLTTTSPPVIETHVQLSHHGWLLILVLKHY